jgi:ketosteroid isomerase-like protein
MKQTTMLAAGLAFANVTWAEAAGGILRPVFDSYFEAWHGSDPQKVLGCFSDDIVIHLWGDGSSLNGKKEVGDKWIIPTMKQYPGNIHHVQNYFEASDQAVIEWVFTGVDASTHKETSDPGCSVYWVKNGLITRGHLYFNAC